MDDVVSSVRGVCKQFGFIRSTIIERSTLYYVARMLENMRTRMDDVVSSVRVSIMMHMWLSKFGFVVNITSAHDKSIHFIRSTILDQCRPSVLPEFYFVKLRSIT